MTTATKQNTSTTTILTDLARKHALLFHDPQGREYAQIIENGKAGYLVERIRSRNFRSWLAKIFYTEKKTAPSAKAVEETLQTLCGIALFDSYELEVYQRVAKQGDNLYIDLANADRQAIEITPQGWGITDKPSVAFWRPRGMAPLPLPAAGGNIDDLFELLHIDNQQTRMLVFSWLLGAFHNAGPYPVLALYGEQGASKSFTSKVIKSLVDPSTSLLRSSPRDLHDLAIGAANNWVLALDNISDIPDWLSDALCRLSTGGGYGTRLLYSDDEEIIIEATRPVILNGITEVVYRPDLLDRAIILTLPAISERKTERELWARFIEIAPGVMGVLFDALSSILANLEAVKIDHMPRMADFAEWIAAAGPGLGINGNDLVTAFVDNQREAESNLLFDDPLVSAFIDYIATVPKPKAREWEGTATELLTGLKSQDYFDSPNARSLSTRLRRLVPSLRRLGYQIEFTGSKPRKIVVRVEG